MTILLSFMVMAASIGFVITYQRGLPGTMRWLALRLLVEARKLDEMRERRDAIVRHALEAEAR